MPHRNVGSTRLLSSLFALALALAALLSVSANAQQGVAVPEGPTALELSKPLPVDSALVTGRLDNGLRYYLRENPKPEKRLELRLVLNVGSILEDESQQGLAHFVEHMAFNGTTHFAKQDLVNYLESIGMRFGADLNAYTSFDQTVYILQVPTDEESTLAKGFEILGDWAQGLRLDGEEIDAERGVVIEEWRSRRGAAQRIQDQQFPVLFKGSRYSERLPIGTKEVLEGFPHEELRRFYREWYRPELMAVVAVGDVETSKLESLVRSTFGGLRGPENPRPREEAEVPDHDETLISIATDPELTRTSVSVAFKRDKAPQGTVGDYRRSFVESLYYSMLNARLAERSQEADPPYLGASVGGGSFARTKDMNTLGAGVREGGLDRGLEAVLTEAERVRRHGFLHSELERQRVSLLRSYERAFNERDKTESRSYASEYIRVFLDGESTPGIAYERALAEEMLPGIGVEEVNTLASQFLGESNRVILVSAPESATDSPPTEEELLAVFRRVEAADIAPWTDHVSEAPLLSAELPEVAIVERVEMESLGVHQWKLANGVRVFLKPTDFKNDELSFTSYSPGGHSLVADEDWVAAMTADGVAGLAGVGDFDLIELGKKLSGKVVQVSSYISELEEGISGGGSPEDLETLFQLIYLYATEPRRDEIAFSSYLSRLEAAVENREARPETLFGDRLQSILSQGHTRRRPFTTELLEEMDLDRSMAIYRERFADLGDAAFFFVGAFDLATIEPLVRSYLGNLPAAGREETYRDVGVRAPRGVVRERVYRGLEDKSRVRITFSGDFEWGRESRYLMASMAQALSMRLRDALREELGGTYGVSAFPSTSHYPRESYRFTVSFGCGPDRVDELVARVFSEIRVLKKKRVEDELVSKIQETQRRQRETDVKRNGFWLSTLRFYDYHGEDVEQILDLETWIQGLSAKKIRASARKWLDEKNYVEVVLLPEHLASKEEESQ